MENLNHYFSDAEENISNEHLSANGGEYSDWDDSFNFGGSEEEYLKILGVLIQEEKSIPLFIEKDRGIYLIAEFEKQEVEKKDLVLSYLGKEMDFKEK